MNGSTQTFSVGLWPAYGGRQDMEGGMPSQGILFTYQDLDTYQHGPRIELYTNTQPLITTAGKTFTIDK